MQETGDAGSIPGSGRSPERGSSNPLWCSCLKNSMDRKAWWATVYGVTKSRTQLSTHTHTHTQTHTNIHTHTGSRKSYKNEHNIRLFDLEFPELIKHKNFVSYNTS